VTGWGLPFTFAYGIPLQPPPANSVVSVFATVPGTALSNDAYWEVECKKVPDGTSFVMHGVCFGGAVRCVCDDGVGLPPYWCWIAPLLVLDCTPTGALEAQHNPCDPTPCLSGALFSDSCQPQITPHHGRLDMGGTRDCFKPVEDASWCDMLTGYNQHQWSQDGIDWLTPAYHKDTDHLGGSYGSSPPPPLATHATHFKARTS
jgi:hypothetical protein